LQSEIPVAFDNTVFDFGTRQRGENTLTCDFSFRNEGGRSVRISYAVATCSCTKVNWTTSSVPPGGTGKVTAVYTKERLSDSFEKIISVFFDGYSKPVLLSIRGRFKDSEDSLESDFTATRGNLGLEDDTFDVGNIVAGDSFANELFVANMGDNSMHLEFVCDKEGVSFNPSVLDIPALSRKYVNYAVIAKPGALGRIDYSCIPVVDGEKKAPLLFHAVAVPDVSGLSQEEINAGAYYSVAPKLLRRGKIKKGEEVSFTFNLTNLADKTIKIPWYGAVTDGVSVKGPNKVAPGKDGVFNVSVDPAVLKKGSNSFRIVVITDSVLKPYEEVRISLTVD
jgi:hypothetical protein